ncbi:N-acetylmuramoyl-L-alanine amidase [Paenibacillus sp. G2S3]|uniref:N-acetylmuramoyl-L-alanine amidase n=1 Tax=Paenibacillus sp. G2S3 TaxID=3047872 RepID=UPI0024C1822E|nr:N-acetylmuramoyl-L-alanine amidase [Paenibacillus sp. G2S3]WHY18838.1 N-acetylmuramoyl-L-alanine amidase [Paenibacillus sp. G2S3]
MKKMIGVTLLTACLLGIAAPQSAEAKTSAESYTAQVYANSLNVRNEPAKNATVVGSIKNGAKVTVTDEQHGWLKVKTGNISGWVAGYYLKKVNNSSKQSGASGSSVASKPSTASSTSLSSTTKVTVTADSLRIRSGPGTQYKVLGSLKAKDSVALLLRQNDWARIRTASGDIGWVAAQYIRTGTILSNTSTTSTVSRTGNLRGKLIVVDPGHGGSDPGMLGTTYNTMEKDLNLQTALYLRDALLAKGARVEMTRTREDQKPTLARRAQMSEALRADAFVSIHYNSSPKKVSGTLTFFYSESDDLKLARAIETRLGQGIGLKSNGLSFGDYHILRENRIPATLVELGFLTNPTDESIVRKSSYQKKAAKAIAEGLADYFRN